MQESIVIGGHLQQSGQPIELLAKYANRHGLIAGATGTGKTVTVQGLVEGFARLGVPVFVADVKGDLSGLGAAGQPHAKVQQRLDHIGLTNFDFAANHLACWDLAGQQGIQVRLSLSELGPQLLSRLLELNDTQEGALTLAFQYADDQGLLMLDLADLKTTLQFLGEYPEALDQGYGRVAKATLAAISRRLLVLEREGAAALFGEPGLQIQDLLRRDSQGRGMINLLAADSLINKPRLYSTFLLWLLAELFETLPEVGDKSKPELVFFFDEAHLLFQDAPKAFLQKVEQVVRLIRSKGVGIYFISQSPADIPDSILAQLGNRIQHALRAYTPKERQAVKVAAQSFRENPGVNCEELISTLGVGEALVSMLQEGGVPAPVQPCLMAPPRSRIGPLTAAERQQWINQEPLLARYAQAVDPHSAHEELQRRMQAQSMPERVQSKARAGRAAGQASSNRQGIAESFMKSVARSIGSNLGRALIRGVLGSLLKR